jgi:hypothetical protein
LMSSFGATIESVIWWYSRKSSIDENVHEG